MCSEETTTLAELKAKVERFLLDREWDSHHSPKNLAMSIAIEAAELMEIFQWVDTQQAGSLREDARTLEHIREEVADVMIYCISFSRSLGFDLAAAIDEKIAKNARKYPVAHAPKNGADDHGSA